MSHDGKVIKEQHYTYMLNLQPPPPTHTSQSLTVVNMQWAEIQQGNPREVSLHASLDLSMPSSRRLFSLCSRDSVRLAVPSNIR